MSRTVAIILLITLLTACHPPAQRGGASMQDIATQTLLQPDNPDGASTQVMEKITTTATPDGTTITETARTETTISGAQDYAAIVSEWAKMQNKDAVVFILGAILISIFAYRRKYPLIAFAFAVAAWLAWTASMLFAWVAVGAGVLLYLAFKFNVPTPGI